MTEVVERGEIVAGEVFVILTSIKLARRGEYQLGVRSVMRKFRKCASLSSAGAKPILLKYGSNCFFAHATASGENNSPLAP